MQIKLSRICDRKYTTLLENLKYFQIDSEMIEIEIAELKAAIPKFTDTLILGCCLPDSHIVYHEEMIYAVTCNDKGSIYQLGISPDYNPDWTFNHNINKCDLDMETVIKQAVKFYTGIHQRNLKSE